MQMSKLAIHYSPASATSAIKKNGILSPSKLISIGSGKKSLLDNYRERIASVYGGTITDDVLLDYLDFQFGNVLGILHAGRNIIYAAFAVIPEGISEGHNALLEGSAWGIDLTALKKDLGEDIQLAVIEIPTNDPKKSTEIQVDLKDIQELLGIDVLKANWSEESSEGFSYGNIPHLAIWTEKGIIPPKYLTLL